MKIIHIIPSLIQGGAERIVIDIVRELMKKDEIDVRLIIFRDNIKYEINDMKNNVIHIPSSVQLSVWKKNKFDLKDLNSFIEKFQPDIIHTHLFEAEIISRSLYYPKVKWFSHFHSNMTQLNNFNFSTIFSKRLLSNYYERRYLLRRYKANRGNLFISISNDTNSYAAKVLPKAFNFHYLKNAIDFKKFNKVKLNKNENILHLINVGSFQAKKNQQFLIDIAYIMKQQNIKFHLKLLGDGEQKKIVEKKIVELNLENEVFVLGNVPNVQHYLTKSDIYLHSAYYEPFGLVLLEAMAAGLPTITLDGKGNRDLIEEGKNGYMIYEQDAEKFADRIIKLWNDKQKMKEISLYTQQYASGFDIKNYCEKLLAIYRS